MYRSAVIKILSEIFAYTLWAIVLTMMTACNGKKSSSAPSMFDSAAAANHYDLPDIENAGELIAVTISGPETYYQYRGKDLGLQYALAEKFANSIGLRLRMEVVRDTLQLDSMLRHAGADLIAYPLPQKLIESHHLRPSGATWVEKKSAWAVRPSSPELAAALDDWFKPEMLSEVKSEQKEVLSTPTVRRHMRAMFVSKKNGIISPYDDIFIHHGRNGGWDWRLLAAIGYQESGFDPEAISWAGARGLMQIMPSTAAHLGIGVNELTHPETNIAASVRYLNELNAHFSDIRDPYERQKFVLAAYNGGMNHIRDAMRLARKYNRNPQSWEVVSYYVLRLSTPQFYRDPVVKSGYMVGAETYNYVNTIWKRYMNYSGFTHGPAPTTGDLHFEPEKAKRRNRFSKPRHILSPHDSLFIISN